MSSSVSNNLDPENDPLENSTGAKSSSFAPESDISANIQPENIATPISNPAFIAASLQVTPQADANSTASPSSEYEESESTGHSSMNNSTELSVPAVDVSPGAMIGPLPEDELAMEPESVITVKGEKGSTGSSSTDEDGKVMTVMEHLGELRTRIIRGLVVFVVAFVVAMIFGKEIISVLQVPANNKFTFIALSIEEPLMVYCKVSFYAALVIAAPYLLLEASLFISPGLRRSERRILSPIVIGGPVLFVLGAAFCYYFVLPPMLSFFSSFGVGISPVQQRLDFYVSLVTTMMLYMGLCFQLPVVLFALSLAGIVNSRMLLRMWRYALVGSSLVAAIITPDPTIVSMLIVLAGLIGLYFATIILLKLFGR